MKGEKHRLISLQQSRMVELLARSYEKKDKSPEYPPFAFENDFPGRYNYHASK